MLKDKIQEFLQSSTFLVDNVIFDDGLKFIINLIHSKYTCPEFLAKVTTFRLKNSSSQIDFINKQKTLIIELEDAKEQRRATYDIKYVTVLGDSALIEANLVGSERTLDKVAQANLSKKAETHKFSDLFGNLLTLSGLDLFEFPDIDSTINPYDCKEYGIKYKTNKDGTVTVTSYVDGKETTKTYKLTEI